MLIWTLFVDIRADSFPLKRCRGILLCYVALINSDLALC